MLIIGEQLICFITVQIVTVLQFQGSTHFYGGISRKSISAELSSTQTGHQKDMENPMDASRKSSTNGWSEFVIMMDCPISQYIPNISH